MTKFLSKLFLCGIMLSSVNYELTYAIEQSQLNIDFDNNAQTDDVKVQTDTTLNSNIIVGNYNEETYTLDSTEKAVKLETAYISKYDTTDKKWYLTDEYGNYQIKDDTADEKIELNKVKLNIQPNYTLTLQNSEGGGKLSL